MDGHDCYHLVAKAKTSGLAEFLFPVDSTAESWLDCDGLFAASTTKTAPRASTIRTTTPTLTTQTRDRDDQPINGREHVWPSINTCRTWFRPLYFVRTRKLMLDSEQIVHAQRLSTNYNMTIRPDLRKSMWVRPVGDIQALRIEPKPDAEYRLRQQWPDVVLD